MILVITKNGNVYINDKAIITVLHERKNKKVYIESSDNKPHTIHEVEQIRYISDTTEVTIEEDGSEVHKLKDQLKAKDAKYNELGKYTDLMRAVVFRLMNKNPELYEEIEKELHEQHPKLFENDSPKVNPGD